jgi:hypothetical protein
LRARDGTCTRIGSSSAYIGSSKSDGCEVRRGERWTGGHGSDKRKLTSDVLSGQRG